MGLIFWLTFGVIGSFLSDQLGTVISLISKATEVGLTAGGFNPVMISLVVDGIFAGVGSVLSFIPTIVVLFFFLSMLEDSGYMARVAFIMDKLLRKIGLSGRSFVPMLIGFGCSVPAIMATRTLPSDRDRRMTILLTPFMSCSAKLPIYGMFTMAFFPDHRAIVMIGLYILGMLLGTISGLILNKTVYRGNPVPFIMELPNYRMPNARTVLLLLWDKAKDFLTRAFTVIFIASLIIWFFQTFDIRFNVVPEAQTAYLPVSAAHCTFACSIVFFRLARIYRTDYRFLWQRRLLSVHSLYSQAPVQQTFHSPAQIFSPLSAISFLVFTLVLFSLHCRNHCVKREMGSTRASCGCCSVSEAAAWAVAIYVFQIGYLFV